MKSQVLLQQCLGPRCREDLTRRELDWTSSMFREHFLALFEGLFRKRRPYFGGVKFGLVSFVPGVGDETRIMTGITL